MKRALAVAALALLLAPFAVQAAEPATVQSFVVDQNHSEVSFQIRHFVTRVRGNFNTFAGTIAMDTAKPENSAVDFTVEAASIDTRNENRDKHLRSADFFEVEKHPSITFKSTRIKALGGDRYEVTGPFTLRGVTKEITVPVSFLGTVKDAKGNVKAGFESTFRINRKDYGVNWNAPMDQGFMLADEVDITIAVEAKTPEPAAAPAKTR